MTEPLSAAEREALRGVREFLAAAQPDRVLTHYREDGGYLHVITPEHLARLVELADRLAAREVAHRAEVEAARADERERIKNIVRRGIDPAPLGEFGRHANACVGWVLEHIDRAVLAQHTEPVAPCGDRHAGDCSLDCSERAAVRELRRVGAWPLAQHAEPTDD